MHCINVVKVVIYFRNCFLAFVENKINTLSLCNRKKNYYTKTVKVNRILCLSILIFLAGCNGDIFVDDYMPKRYDETTISETNNSKEINFKADNWGLIKIVCETSDQYTIKAYTIDGESTSFPFEEKELGTVHITNDYIDVQVEKKSGKKLKVILNENLMNENVRMLIEVGNSFKLEVIEVQLAPTQKYQIDSIVYDFDKFETYRGGLKEMEYLIVNNKSSLPITVGFLPYRKSTHEIRFSDPTKVWDEELFTHLLGVPLPEITIPDIVDGKPVLRDSKVAFGMKEQHLAVGLDKKLSVDVTIDGFDKRKVIVFNEMRDYSVPYKVYISNPRTGKELTFSGKLNSSEPIDYFILKRVWDENE